MKKNTILYAALCMITLLCVVIGLFVSTLSSQGYPLQKHIAFLYVGRDTGKQEMILEKKVQDELVKMRDREGFLSGDLPVVSYHFDKEREREACEDKFGIWESQLPYLCVVELNDKDIPIKVLFHIESVKAEDRRVPSVFDSGVKLLQGGKIPEPVEND